MWDSAVVDTNHCLPDSACRFVAVGLINLALNPVHVEEQLFPSTAAAPSISAIKQKAVTP